MDAIWVGVQLVYRLRSHILYQSTEVQIHMLFAETVDINRSIQKSYIILSTLDQNYIC